MCVPNFIANPDDSPLPVNVSADINAVVSTLHMSSFRIVLLIFFSIDTAVISLP